MAKEIFLPPKDYFYLGKLGKTFGLKGGIRFYAVGRAEAESIFKITEVFIANFGMKELKNVARGANTIVFIAGIENINDAKPLVNAKIYTPSSHLPILAEGIYHDTLIEKPVWVDGKKFGEVTNFLTLGKQEVLIVNGEHMVPLKASYVVLTNEAVHINHPPKGLL